MSITRRAAVVICGGALLAASAPTIASGVQKATDVFIANGDDRPVPTKAIGTTPVSGSVSVPAGVTVNGKPSVAVPDGVSINGPVSVAHAAPERYQKAIAVDAPSGGDEQCQELDVPEGKRLIVEAVHFVMGTDADLELAYALVVHSTGNGASANRYRPEAAAGGDSGHLEGPLIGDADTAISVCAGSGPSGDPSTFVGATVVGILEDE